MAIDVLKLKKGTVYRAVFSKNRKRITRCFDRKWDAQRWLDEQEKLHHFGYRPALLFKEAAQLWLVHHAKTKKAPGSYQNDQRMVKSFDACFGEKSLEQITPEVVENYISQMLTKEIKPATVNRHLQCLRTILNYFVKKRQLLTNVVSIVGLLPELEASYDYLSFEEADRFLAGTRQKYAKKNQWVYRLYLLAINTGMRWGEIAALKWDKVDLLNQRITICRSYCNFSKQIRETTKGRKIRYMGINSSLLPELRKQAEEVSKLDNPLNLSFPKNRQVVDLKNFKRDHFEKDLEQVGIRLIRFHDLRHTFASHFMMKGGNLYDLQKLMGHSDIATTERYAHLSIESVTSKAEIVAIDGEPTQVIDLQKYLKKKAG